MNKKFKFQKINACDLNAGDLFFNTTVEPDEFVKDLTETVGVSIFIRGDKGLPYDGDKLAKVWRVTITTPRKSAK